MFCLLKSCSEQCNSSDTQTIECSSAGTVPLQLQIQAFPSCSPYCLHQPRDGKAAHLSSPAFRVENGSSGTLVTLHSLPQHGRTQTAVISCPHSISDHGALRSEAAPRHLPRQLQQQGQETKANSHQLST